jgi:hypothetical protein
MKERVCYVFEVPNLFIEMIMALARKISFLKMQEISMYL